MRPTTLCLICCLALFWAVIGTDIITTIAGTGSNSCGSNSVAGTSTSINSPSGIVLDSSGNVYFNEHYCSKIRKLTVSTGILTTYAGTGTAGYSGDGTSATAAKLNYPNGLSIDSSNNIYVADQVNNRIRKISAETGYITTVVGSSSTGAFSGDGASATAAKLDNPVGVAIDTSGILYLVFL